MAVNAMTFVYICLGILFVVGAAVGLFVYGSYVEKADQMQARRSLLFAIGIITLIDILMTSSDFLTVKFLTLSLITNIWCFLDGALRFPNSHDITCLLTWKMLTLLLLKSVFFVIWYEKRASLSFIILFFVSLWGIPVFYMMSFPLGSPKSVRIRSMVEDEDMIVRIYHLLTSRHTYVQLSRFIRHHYLELASSIASGSSLADKISSPRVRAMAKEKKRVQV
eukprot:GDKJ01049487.1.p1 GENE.GDKJ01049487.1~~GDKJ01049487.1.p1  ORF type:complete len:222 (+),score=15.08 GDKJ01049487.1:42-707(+)